VTTPAIHARYISVGGLRTHYLEAGEGPVIVLLHSGEFGGCSELTWEYNIAALARHFRVVAPDWLGYGKTAKFFDFEDMWHSRIAHITGFIEAMNIDRAHFIGNSMGGTMLLYTAAMPDCPWPIERLVAVSGGGHVPDNAARQILNNYDGSIEQMRKIVSVLFKNPAIASDEAYVRRRHELSLVPGAWECTAAPRLRLAGRPAASLSRPTNYANIKQPCLLIAGEADPLREPGWADALRREIPGARLHVMKDAGHCPQIDAPDEFNRLVLDYLHMPQAGLRSRRAQN
jgi:pimeloyl-ACP methyl ester carboxylesterase